jgi:hypothetical protein
VGGRDVFDLVYILSMHDDEGLVSFTGAISYSTIVTTSRLLRCFALSSS